MSNKTIAALRSKTEKLKEVAALFQKQVEESTQELNEINITISNCDIELSLINDAFAIRFGDMEQSERDDLIQAMENLTEIEKLEDELEREQAQVQWQQNEIQRLNGIAPTNDIEDVDVNELLQEQARLNDEIQSTRIRNTKREKNIRLAENKINSSTIEIQELHEKIEQYEQENQENEKLRKQVDEIVNQNNQLTEQFKKENGELHEIQNKLTKTNEEISTIRKFLDDHETHINQDVKIQDALQGVYDEIYKANEPYQKCKDTYDAFISNATNSKVRINEHIEEIDHLIEALKHAAATNY